MTLPALELWFRGDAHGEADGNDRPQSYRPASVSGENAGSVATPLESESLWAAIATGDSQVFRAVFDAYAVVLVRYAMGFVRTRAIAEEVVQDAFVILWDQRGTLSVREGSLRAYLFGIVRHRCIDVVRRGQTEARVTAGTFEIPPSALPSDESEYAELDRRVRATLQTLSPKVCEVLTLRLRDEMSYAEIAAVLGVSLKTVESHMSNGLRRLRAALADFRPAGQ